MFNSVERRFGSDMQQLHSNNHMGGMNSMNSNMNNSGTSQSFFPGVNPPTSSDEPNSCAPNRQGEHMMGTTIMAVCYDGGVVMGADSRTSTGTYVANRVSDKISQVSDSIFCCRSGSAADTQAIKDIVKYYLDIHRAEAGVPPTVQTAAKLFGDLCYGNKDRLMAGIICAGYDEQDGGSVYCIPLGGTLIKQPFALGGSGSTYIYAYCDANYKKGMTKDECLVFVKTALAHAMSRDGSSGGIIRTVTLSKDGIEKSYTPGDKLAVN